MRKSGEMFLSHQRLRVWLCPSGVARGGREATIPLAETLPPPCPPQWNYTLYRGLLWRAAILSPGQPPPRSLLSPPCRPLILKSLATPLLCPCCLPAYLSLQVNNHLLSSVDSIFVLLFLVLRYPFWTILCNSIDNFTYI